MKIKILVSVLALAIIAAIVVTLPSPSQSQGYNAFHQLVTSTSGADISLQENSVILYHKLAWTVTGSPAGCTVKLEQSADNSSWSDLIANQTCTSNGNSAVINASNTWVRINVTALSGGSSPVLTTTYTGYVQNPSGGGGTGPLISAPLNCIAASGSGTAYTCTTNPTFVPAAGNIVLFVADVASGASPTLNVNSSSALPITTMNLAAASVNNFAAGSACLLYDDGTHWQMLCLNPGAPGALGGTSASTMTISTADIRNTISVGAGAGKTLISANAPTISSGFGTSPSIVANNGTGAFTINVGTGGAASSGVIGLPNATTGWICSCTDITTNSANVFQCKQTATATNTATIGNFSDVAVATAWVASDVVQVSCAAF